MTLGLDAGAVGGPLPITSSRMGHLLDALAQAYDVLGFGAAADGDKVFRDLVLARVIEPSSKLDSLRVLGEAGPAAGASYLTMLRRLPAYARPEFRQQLSAACAAHARLGPASLVLYDVSTLYFETDHGDGQVRKCAWVADITGLLDLQDWPAGMRVIIRKERPHPGAQLRFTDVDGHRFTAFATNARKGHVADLELRHRRRARREDRVRNAKDTGLRNLPLKGFAAANRVWCKIVALTYELLAWAQMIAWPARRPAAGNRNGSGSGCSPSPDAWPAAAACGCASPNDGPGPPSSPSRSPACRPCQLADQPQPTRRPGRTDNGPVKSRPPGATAGHRPHQKINPSRVPQASRSRARKTSQELRCQAATED